MGKKMNKYIILSATTLLLSACVTDPNSPFYTGTTQETPAVVEDVVTETPDVEDVIDAEADLKDENMSEMDENGDEDKDEVVASADQCLASDVLANTTFTVVPKGTKGTIEKSGGSEYFVTGGTRHDVTNVPYSLTNC